MQRINSAGSTKDGRFTEGDPINGIEPTHITAKWLNDIQDVCCEVDDEMKALKELLDGKNAQMQSLILQAMTCVAKKAYEEGSKHFISTLDPVVFSSGHTHIIQDLGESRQKELTPRISEGTIKKLKVTNSFKLRTPPDEGSGFCEILVTNDDRGGNSINFSDFSYVYGKYDTFANVKHIFRISKFEDMCILEISRLN